MSIILNIMVGHAFALMANGVKAAIMIMIMTTTNTTNDNNSSESSSYIDAWHVVVIGHFASTWNRM